MMRQNINGFTVIEVMIFLAISGLLIMIAFIGAGTSISHNRFVDGMRQTQAHIQQQYSDVQNGLNARLTGGSLPSGCGVLGMDRVGANKCLLLGKLIVFEAGLSSIKNYPVIATNDVTSQEGVSSDGEALELANLQVVDLPGQFDIPWGIELLRGCMNLDNTASPTSDLVLAKCPTTTPFNSLLVVKSPLTGVVLSYVFNRTSSVTNGALVSNLSDPVINFGLNTATTKHRVAANICFKSAGVMTQYAGMQVGGSAFSGQSTNLLNSGMSKTDMEAVCGI